MSSRQAESSCHGLNCVPRRDACVLTDACDLDLLGGGASCRASRPVLLWKGEVWAWRQTLREGRRSRTAEDDHVAITTGGGQEGGHPLILDSGPRAVRPSAAM